MVIFVTIIIQNEEGWKNDIINKFCKMQDIYHIIKTLCSHKLPVQRFIKLVNKLLFSSIVMIFDLLTLPFHYQIKLNKNCKKYKHSYFDERDCTNSYFPIHKSM